MCFGIAFSEPMMFFAACARVVVLSGMPGTAGGVVGASRRRSPARCSAVRR